MRKSLLAGLAVAALLATPSLAQSDEPVPNGETWVSYGFLPVPGKALTSFDISWVDTGLNVYALADRSNASIDTFNISTTSKIFQIIPAAPNNFAGNVPTCTIANACNGPNGIITLRNAGGQVQLWAGDGPTNNPVCTTSCSTVKVFNAAAALVTVIPTGGAFRADELCFAPPNPAIGRPGLVLIANDADAPPFVSLIPTDGPNAFQVIQTIRFPVATNGIEQCQWDGTIGTRGRFLLNVPEVNGDGTDSVNGGVFTIDPGSGAPGAATITPDPTNLGLTGNVDIATCAGPQGMAIGPRPGVDVLLGCNAPVVPASASVSNSVVIDKGTGAGIGGVVPGGVLQGAGGADQVWFDPVANHYSIAEGTTTDGFPQQLGIVDAGPPPVIDQQIQIGFPGGTARRSHSVAAWSGTPLGLPPTSVVFLPVSATGGSTTVPPGPGFQSTVCGAMAAQGCIAVFGTTPIPNPDND
jgi:hypothetical protein